MNLEKTIVQEPHINNQDELRLKQMPRLSRLSEQALLCSTHKDAAQVGESLGVGEARVLLESFPNSETRVEVHESVRNKQVYVIASIKESVNESLMKTVLLVQALKLADAERVTVILPYYPYSRQDRKTDERSPISARVVADMLKAVGAYRIVTVDLHATQVEGFFDGPFENLSGLNQIVPHLLEAEGSNLVVVSPDVGGAKRAEGFARRIEKLSAEFTPLIVMSKFRKAPGIPPVVTLSCNDDALIGKTCVLVDDMVDTGGTILAAGAELKQRGAARVLVTTAHGIFSDNAIVKLAEAKNAQGQFIIDGVFTTDTLRTASAGKDLVRAGFRKVISIKPLLAEAIRRLDQPLGSLRDLKDRSDLGELIA